ncbi:MAG: amidohydrolase family protein [Alphaproteobacteria bacterium]|nr:amidohydrolase family protein [Alphaproteobacteria bacterium]
MARRLIATLALGALFLAAEASAAPLVIGGTVITPDGPKPNSWIVIDQGRIQSIESTQPSIPGAKVLATNDLIFPGFVDLHDHPLYNVIPRWQPGRLFKNRYEWRTADDYKAAIANPQSALVNAGGRRCDDDEYSEVKALIGGTTTLIGVSPSVGGVPSCANGLARNIDIGSGFYPRGTPERVRNEIGMQFIPADNIRDMPPERIPEIAGQLQRGELDLLAIHIGEGKRSDPLSRSELDLLDKAGLLGPHTAIIHGVALDAAAFARVHAAGAALVWSPRSNIELYGETTNVGAARAAGVPIAIAPDWSPSGSTNTLAELRYIAALSPRKSGARFTAKELFEMATIVPARIAHADDRIGSLAPGKSADLFLIPGDPAKPYDALIKATPQAIELTMIAGEPIYGTQANLVAALGLKDGAALEAIEVCGASRALNPASLPSGPLAEASARLAKVLADQKSSLAPLAECLP